ncbi:MAG: hypothetical protein JWN44_7275 [Myxococcales bacterium]|nr:hypothetical protein [Myxococcales bacterium]
MLHSILIWMLAGFIVSRLLFRARMRRRFGHAGGGGCGRGFHRRMGRFGGAIDLGAPDAEGQRHFGRWGKRWSRWQSEMRDPGAGAARPVVDVIGTLELNQRQREIYDEVMTRAKSSLPAVSLAEALAIVGREPFDKPALDFLVANAELADDFEHLHHSLTAEQRAKLRAVASA